MKSIMLIILLIGILSESYSQNLDIKLTHLVLEDIIDESSLFKIKENLKGVKLLINPVTGKESITYDTKIKKNVTLKYFDNLSNEHKIKILKSKQSPVLLTDTFIIVDKLKFFPEKSFNDGKCGIAVSIVRQHNCNIQCNKCLFLYAVGVRNNSLILSFTSKKNYLYDYYFDFTTADIQLIKSSVVSREHVSE